MCKDEEKAELDVTSNESKQLIPCSRVFPEKLLKIPN